MGKVHGSLTRAGKVRKQTPKVEKKERIRKLVCGRAKKRTQYQATAIKYCVKNNLNFRVFNKNGTLREEE